MTRIGDLQAYITLQYPTRVSDSMGGFTVTYSDAASVWAKKSTLRSDEAIMAMQSTGIAIHNFVIRFRRDVNSTWRIKEGNKYYAIIGPPIDVNNRHEWLQIEVQEAA